MKTKQHRTHKIRLYPNAQQRAKLLRVEELTRVVYNWAVLLIYNWYEDLDAHTWANGGHGTTPTTPVNCTYGGTFSMPAALTETGYTFNKWNVNSKTFNGGQASVACTSANLGVTSGSATITASWTTNKINIVWNGIDNQNVKTADNKAMTNFNSSTHTAKSQVDYNGNIATPEAARAIAGQTFVGWKFVNPNNNSND